MSNTAIYMICFFALQLIAKGAGSTLSAMGISESDFKLTTGVNCWLASDRPRVRATLDAVLFGSLDVAGLPRFNVPAEYIAACLVVMVSPVNYHVACAWYNGALTSDDMSMSEDVSAAEPVSARRLFALLVQLHGDEAVGLAQAKFSKRVGLAIDHAVNRNKGKGKGDI